jgi:glyoxylase-like metal-dependent hydrolase (beta-lactamase superfamily II)
MAVVTVHTIDYDFVAAYLLDDGDSLTLVDTGVPDTAARVIDTIERLGRPLGALRQIILTHGHADHTGSAADLAARTGAAVLAHALDAPIIRGESDMCPPILSDLERPYAEQAASRVMPAPHCAVTRELTDGDRIDVGSGATVIHTPGHTPGSIALHFEGDGLLICGDAVASLNGRPIVGFFNCDPAQATRSFARLAELDFDTAYFGHGTPLLSDASAAFRKLRDHLNRA